MQVGNAEVQTLYQLSWEQSNGRRRTRWYTRRGSAESKAAKMRADGKDSEIREGIVVFTGSDMPAAASEGAGEFFAEPKGAARPGLPFELTVEAVFARVGDSWTHDLDDDSESNAYVRSTGDIEPFCPDDDDEATDEQYGAWDAWFKRRCDWLDTQAAASSATARNASGFTFAAEWSPKGDLVIVRTA